MRIISGGQTGADQGGLDAAIECGIRHSGWCPKGRRSEAGRIPLVYDLKEHDDWRYTGRTEQNVIASDATVIFTHGPLTGGSTETERFCKKHDKPYVHIDLLFEGNEELLFEFLNGFNDAVVNVAGNRESKSIGIQQETKEILVKWLKLQIK